MRLYGFDAINYVKTQGGKLNRYPDGIPGVEYDIPTEKAREIAADYPFSIWTDALGRSEE